MTRLSPAQQDSHDRALKSWKDAYAKEQSWQQQCINNDAARPDPVIQEQTDEEYNQAVRHAAALRGEE